MTNPEVTEFFAQRTEEVVGQDPGEKHPGEHRSAFEAKPSVAQAPKKSRGTVRLVMQYHYEFSEDQMKSLEQLHGRKYPDAVDFARALLSWLEAEGQTPSVQQLAATALKTTWDVSK